MPRKTLIIFDVDGTLVYSNRVDSQCFAETYQLLYRRPFPSIDWTHYPHVTDTTIFSTVIRQHFQRLSTDEEVKIFQHHFVERLKQERAAFPEKFNLVPGARQAVLTLLDDNRFVLGIATGGWQKPAQFKLDHVGIPHHRFLFQGADAKPTREAIINGVLEKATHLQMPYERVVYIGDALWDVKTMRNLNMPFIGIRWKNDKHILHEAGAHTVIQDYLDLDAFIDAVHNAQVPAEKTPPDSEQFPL